MKNKQTNAIDAALMACRSVLFKSFFFGFIINLLILALPIYSLQVLDRVISSGSLDTLVMLSLVVLVAFIALSLVQTARSFALSRSGEWLEKKLSPELLQHSFSKAVYGNAMPGSQNLRDLGTIKQFVSGQALTTIIDMPWALIFIGVLYAIHPVHGIVTTVAGVLLLLLAYINDKTTKSYIEKSNEANIRSMNQVDIALRNAEVVEAMGFADRLIAKWQQTNNEGSKLQRIVGNRSSIISGTSKFLRMFVQMIIIGAGGYLVLQGQLSVGAIIAGSILVGRALAPFESAIMSWKTVVNTGKSYARLKETVERSILREESMQLPNPKGVLDVEGVYFSLSRESGFILNNVSFSLNPGQALGIIGNSASGKSTLAKVIVGVYKPTKGIVRLDKADIYTWNRSDIGNHLGYLPQDVELFDGTVKDNIARMDTEASPEAIVKAAKIAGVHELILTLPNGYETEIGVGGARLSAGQRQRLALARAFYGDPKLVVMDEPNSNLDMAGDVALAKALQYAKQNGITTIVVSHRPSIMNCVDQIIMMKDGMASNPETPKEVMEKMGKNVKAIDKKKVA